LRRALLGWRHGQGDEEEGGREARTPTLAPISGRDAKDGGKIRAHQRVRREKEAEALPELGLDAGVGKRGEEMTERRRRSRACRRTVRLAHTSG